MNYSVIAGGKKGEYIIFTLTYFIATKRIAYLKLKKPCFQSFFKHHLFIVLICFYNSCIHFTIEEEKKVIEFKGNIYRYNKHHIH